MGKARYVVNLTSDEIEYLELCTMLFHPRKPVPSHANWNFTTPPKYGSWLNIAEIELTVLANMCPDRIPDEEPLHKHVEANVKARNTKAIPVKCVAF